MIFKIRRLPDGFYSTGGITPKFSKNGKQWTSKGSLKNHLNIVDLSYYKNCELVRFDLEEKGNISFNFKNQTLKNLIIDSMAAN